MNPLGARRGVRARGRRVTPIRAWGRKGRAAGCATRARGGQRDVALSAIRTPGKGTDRYWKTRRGGGAFSFSKGAQLLVSRRGRGSLCAGCRCQWKEEQKTRKFVLPWLWERGGERRGNRASEGAAVSDRDPALCISSIDHYSWTLFPVALSTSTSTRGSINPPLPLSVFGLDFEPRPIDLEIRRGKGRRDTDETSWREREDRGLTR